MTWFCESATGRGSSPTHCEVNDVPDRADNFSMLNVLHIITGIPIVQISATDSDSKAPYNRLTYHITTSSAPGIFTINSDGQLSLLQEISNR